MVSINVHAFSFASCADQGLAANAGAEKNTSISKNLFNLHSLNWLPLHKPADVGGFDPHFQT